MDKHAQATVANVMLRDERDIQTELEQSKNTVQNLFSGGRIRAVAFEEFARLAVRDINNSKTELIYPPEGGILAQDKTNQLRQVRLTSAGLGISTDGWQTLKAAVTADGVMGERIVGQIGNFDSLSIGSGNEIILLNHTGLAAGNANFNDSPFRVDMEGNVVARKITLTGTIGNNLYMGLIGEENDRRIEFVNSSGYQAYISYVSSDNSHLLKIRAGNDIRIDSGLYLSLTGMVITLNGDSYIGSNLPGNRIVTASELDATWTALAGKANASHSHSVTLPDHNHGNPANANSGGGTFTGSLFFFHVVGLLDIIRIINNLQNHLRERQVRSCALMPRTKS